MKTAAIYARVSSDKQKEENTIASQTAALIAFAAEQGYAVPTEWIFEDEGYSGASLIRPGLERVRDLAAEGELDAVLVYAPDRLSRRYAYQILLIEELARAGVETLFIRSPRATTAEDQLLLQFQGMIAEYERAQIIERSRRGKRHRAQQGTINVLSGAPYGYRYVKKSDNATAYYEVIDAEAEVVRLVFDTYTKEGLSINAITRLLNDRRIPTRTGSSRWNGLRCGPCCATRLIKAKHASARQSYVRGSASHAAYVNAIGCQLATAPIMNGRVKTGSRFPFPPWSVKIHSL